MWSMISVATTYEFTDLAGMLSGPDDFLLLVCLMDILISRIVDGVTSVGEFVCAVMMSGGISEADLLKSASKCYTNLFVCP